MLVDAHGAGSSAHLPEAPLDGIGGPGPLSPGWIFEQEEGEKFVEIFSQGVDDLGVLAFPLRREATGHFASLLFAGSVVDAA